MQSGKRRITPHHSATIKLGSYDALPLEAAQCGAPEPNWPLTAHFYL